jgi:hypothetical protein
MFKIEIFTSLKCILVYIIYDKGDHNSSHISEPMLALVA